MAAIASVTVRVMGMARESAQLWRCQVLPVAEVDYRDRKIDFTASYLADLVTAFGECAFDFVPVQRSRDGTHSSDPALNAGTVTGLELPGDGLDVIASLAASASAVLSEVPLFGALRIVESYRRADGREFAAAIQHVLITDRPLIKGMRPWRPA